MLRRKLETNLWKVTKLLEHKTQKCYVLLINLWNISQKLAKPVLQKPFDYYGNIFSQLLRKREKLVYFSINVVPTSNQGIIWFPHGSLSLTFIFSKELGLVLRPPPFSSPPFPLPFPCNQESKRSLCLLRENVKHFLPQHF